jgi:hypothetical protein
MKVDELVVELVVVTVDKMVTIEVVALADCLVVHSAGVLVSYWAVKLVSTDLQRVVLWVSRVDWKAKRENISK